MNQVTMIGRISRDLETKTLSNGSAMVKTSIAVNRDYFNKEGKREVDFFFMTIFGKRAEIFAKYMDKGSLVMVNGNLRNMVYEKDGQKKYRNDFIVDNFEFLESKTQAEQRRLAKEGVFSQNDGEKATLDNDSIAVSEDELPF